ncbi:MAG: peroxiredoxin [Steroidobacteraceae bacterium]|jgi:peroxiredoxin Q/BCP
MSAAKTKSKPKPKSKAKAKPKPKQPPGSRGPKRTASARVALGRKVPAFKLPATSGRSVALKDAGGSTLVLYFYPRDNTPGCTLEGRQFAALAPQFAAAGITLYGVSRDSLASHERFRAQHGLPFELLSDADETLCRLFDVIREKNMYGRKMLGVERSTFLIDGTGVLRREWRRVKVEGHAQEVLDAARSL